MESGQIAMTSIPRGLNSKAGREGIATHRVLARRINRHSGDRANSRQRSDVDDAARLLHEHVTNRRLRAEDHPFDVDIKMGVDACDRFKLGGVRIQYPGDIQQHVNPARTC